MAPRQSQKIESQASDSEDANSLLNSQEDALDVMKEANNIVSVVRICSSDYTGILVLIVFSIMFAERRSARPLKESTSNASRMFGPRWTLYSLSEREECK